MRDAIRFRFFNDHTCVTARSFFFMIILLFCAVITLLMDGISLAEKGVKTNHILYINSYNPGYSWSDDIEKGLFERFKLSNLKMELSVEYLDSRRFPEPELLNKQADIMLAKYTKYRHDLVIVSDNAAFNFAIKYQKRLFPGIPIVFCGYNNFHPDILRGLTNITGVNEEIDIKGLIETAIYIQPKIRTLAFVLSTGDLSSKLIAEKAEKYVIPQYQDQYKIVLLKDAPMTRIRRILSRLKHESAVFLIGQTSDVGEGRALTPTENGYLISATSPVPAYTFWTFHLDTGVLGGRILTGYDQGKAAGEMAINILNGKSADSIPVLMQSPTKYIFDYKVMKRFNIAMDDLPENSMVINKPYSFYEANKKIVWVVLIVFATLTAFIIALSVNIFQRLRAEKELQKHRDYLQELVKERTAELTDSNRALADSEERFRCLSDAAFEGIVFTEKGIIIEVNNTCCEMFGYRPSEIIDKAATDFISPEERENVKSKVLSGYNLPYETRGLRRDGSTFPIEVHAKMFSYKGREVRVSAIRDLTKQKKAEEEIKTLRGILPICSFCKKIRDDKGYWEKVDVYIHKYSQADISHGVCPECMKKHYPKEYQSLFDESE